MLELNSLGPVIITMKNGLMAHGLCLCVCVPGQLGLGLHVNVSVCVPFNHPPRIHLPLPGLRLRLSLNSLRENGKQSEANCRAATGCCTQVDGEVLRALTGRSLAVSKQQLTDGCGAEMIHTDNNVSPSVP